MLIDCDGYQSGKREYPSVLSALADNRVVDVAQLDGGFIVCEQHTGDFYVRLTPEQLAALGRELIALSGVTP